MRRSHINSGKLRSLHPILKEWIRLNRLYGKTALWKDCAWWANERASAGILAAAVWTYGGVALEEYSTKKVRKKEHRTGRCDLFFNVGEKFACEIKQIFPRLKDGETGDISNVKAQFALACDDARNLLRQEGRRLGICFVTPRFPRSQIPYMDNCLKDYLDCLQQKLNFDTIAWYFPKEARNMEWPENKRIYPGIIVLIREVFRSR
jgi:hypothetical protein